MADIGRNQARKGRKASHCESKLFLPRKTWATSCEALKIMICAKTKLHNIIIVEVVPPLVP